MRMLDEVYRKADKDEICQKCGCDIPQGSNCLVETYTSKGSIITNIYCIKPRCNPINNLGLRLFWGAVSATLFFWIAWGIWVR